MNKFSKISYCKALLDGFEYLLENHQEVFVIGQGLWSPWYVGNSMKDLDKKYGKSRIIDTPISENAVTGAAVGASLCGSKPIVVNPRMDFMLYAMDPIINQAAKWSYMFGGKSNPQVTIRSYAFSGLLIEVSIKKSFTGIDIAPATNTKPLTSSGFFSANSSIVKHPCE